MHILHHLHDLICTEAIIMDYHCPTKDMVVNLLMKALSQDPGFLLAPYCIGNGV
jgi:hypothetical protein